MDPSSTLVSRAQRLADDLLFPASAAVEASGIVPISHLDALAAAGLFAIARDATSAEEFHGVVEALAGGCLATAFVWLQHHGLVRQLLRPDAPPALRAELLDDLCAGRRRAGVAQAGLLPGEPRLVATRVHGGVRLDGSSPWITGWGLVDVVLVAARRADDPDTVVWLAVDAHEGDGLRVEPLRLRAVDAARSVVAQFDGLAVPADRVVAEDPFAVVGYAAGTGLRTNGSLALGHATRSARLAGADGLLRRVAASRARLDAADDAELPDARAEASLLAVEAAAAAVAHAGASAVVEGAVAGRLAEEATFLLVFGSRPSIRAALVDRLDAGA